MELPRKNSRYLLNESNLYGDRTGPHRLDNDIDLTVTLSNDRGMATWWLAASKEGSLEQERLSLTNVNLSEKQKRSKKTGKKRFPTLAINLQHM